MRGNLALRCDVRLSWLWVSGSDGVTAVAAHGRCQRSVVVVNDDYRGGLPYGAG